MLAMFRQHTIKGAMYKNKMYSLLLKVVTVSSRIETLLAQIQISDV